MNPKKSNMKKYVGMLIVTAIAMNLGDYNKKRGWEIPADEDPNQEGYYTVRDSGKEQWQSKEDFEAEFKPFFEPHQERVIEEKILLDENLKKLRDFFFSPIFTKQSDLAQGLLRDQAEIMSNYSEVLAKRISNF